MRTLLGSQDRPKRLAVSATGTSRRQRTPTPDAESRALDSQLQIGVTAHKYKRKRSPSLHKTPVDKDSIWPVRGFSRLWTPASAKASLLSPPYVQSLKDALNYWLWPVVLLGLYTSIIWISCFFAYWDRLQPDFCSSVQDPSIGIRPTCTPSLFEDLINASTRSTDIMSYAFQFDRELKDLATLSRLHRFINIQSDTWFLEPRVLKTKRRKKALDFDDAYRKLITLSFRTKPMLDIFPDVYIEALDDAIRYTNDTLEQLVLPSALEYRIRRDPASGTDYTEEAYKVKLHNYYFNMRGIIQFLLKRYGGLHSNLDAIALQIRTIFDAIDGDKAMSNYRWEQHKRRKSWRELLYPSSHDDTPDVEAALKKYEQMKARCHKILSFVEQLEYDLNALLPQIAVYEANIDRSMSGPKSALQSKRLEWNTRRIERNVKAALELRSKYADGARQFEEMLKTQEEETIEK
ncbi:hypothetical protein MMC11_005927 [Xylographa trunciseda]|nr:hypothetical protein [Xylographa trunciseda]